MERKADSDARKKVWNEKFGTGPDGGQYTLGAERQQTHGRGTCFLEYHFKLIFNLKVGILTSVY